MIKVIASDFDGTILKDGAQSVDEIYFDIINKLIDLGIIFIAASGRTHSNLMNLMEPIKDKIYFIAENGALIARGNEVIKVNEIDKTLANGLIEDLRSIDGSNLFVSGKNYGLIESVNDKFISHMTNTVKNDIKKVKSLIDEKEDYIKISSYWFEGRAKEIDKDFKAKYGDRLNIVDGGGNWLDFMRKDSDKGEALKYLAKELDFSLDEVMAFGDSENDVGMLKIVKESYAMNTASEEVKKVSNKTCSLVSDVILDFINHR